MGRAPCCWAIGLKKGPWTHDEDEILKSFVEKHGHSNWRALPKLAGLLRCGKSCRLRWINYLRPDVKRGNFTKEEDETIIKLHATLGNKWSAIAVQLPGRTDNEIKNAWHTRLKKRVSLDMKQPRRLHENDSLVSSEGQSEEGSTLGSPPPVSEEESSTAQLQDHIPIFSPEHSYSDLSSFLNSEPNDYNKETLGADSSLFNSIESFLELDGSFWSDPISSADEVVPFTATNYDDQMGIWRAEDPAMISNDGLDFWYSLFLYPEGLERLSNESQV